MKKLIVLSILFSMVVIGINANAAEKIEKYWERGCGVVNTADDVRNMAVWQGRDILATVNRTSGPDAIKLFNATTGLMEEVIEHLDMTGIPEALYAVTAGDFSEDGAFFACSLSYNADNVLKVYYWENLSATPELIVDLPFDTRRGDALDVIGSVGDNSVSILISGNTAASIPLRITYDGSDWTATALANAVRAQDIHQMAGGKFYATYAGGNIVRYNADGSVDAEVVPDTARQTSIAVDEARGLIYAMGYASPSTAAYSNQLMVYDATTGALLADMTSDPLDVLGSFTGTTNGSSAVEFVTYPGGVYIYALSERMGCARYSYSTVLTVGPTGDFPNIRSAISSYCITDGTQADAIKPLVIEIDPAGGPYDEALNLIASATGYGDIAGDLVLKSAGPGKAVVKLRQGHAAFNFGLTILQNTANVILKDLILCPSLTNPYTHDMVVMREASANAQENWVEFYGCILTDINTSGDPMITSAVQALDEPVASGSPSPGSGQDGRTHFRFGGANLVYSMSLFMEQSVNYFSKHLNYVILDGASSQARIHNSIVSYPRAAGYYVQSRSGNSKLIITGDDQSASPFEGDTINCSIIYEFNRRLFYDYAAGVYIRESPQKKILVVKNSIITTTVNHSQSHGISTYPAGANITADILKVHDVIIDVPSWAIADQFAYPSDFRRSTIKTPSEGVRFVGNGISPANFTDCIFAECLLVANKLAEPTGTINLIHCALPEVGPDAIGSVTGGVLIATIINPVTGDPVFASLDPLAVDYLDVMGPDYQGAASDGSDLSGGGNWIGSSVDDWTAY